MRCAAAVRVLPVLRVLRMLFRAGAMGCWERLCIVCSAVAVGRRKSLFGDGRENRSGGTGRGKRGFIDDKK